MPAANIETIYKFEDAIEAAVKTNLTDNATLTTYRQRDRDSVAAPFCAVQLSGVTAAGNVHVDASNVGWDSDFTAQLSVVVVTNRVKEGASSTHAATLGKVRRYLCDLTKWTDAALPYLKVWSVTNSGSTPTVDEENRYDITTLNFGIKFLIREDAWPT